MQEQEAAQDRHDTIYGVVIDYPPGNSADREV